MRKEPLKIHRHGGFPYVIAEAYVRLVAEEAGLIVGKSVRYVHNGLTQAWVFQIGELSEDGVAQLMLRMLATESCHFGI